MDKVGANHHEPTSDYNPALALFTAAWFKLFVDRTPRALGVDFEALVYGPGDASLCGGGDGAMAECTLLRQRGQSPRSNVRYSYE